MLAVGSLDKRKLADGSLIADEDKTKTRREHRMVVRPEWQGLGVGPALSDFSAALWKATPHEDATKTHNPCWRYMSTTAHPRFGQCECCPRPACSPPATTAESSEAIAPSQSVPQTG